MNIVKKIIKGMLILLFTSCGSDKCSLLLRESNVFYSNSQEYLDSVDFSSSSTEPNTYFVFANNPFELDESYQLVIYLNNKPIYVGRFQKSLKLNINESIIGQRSHFAFEVLTPLHNGKYFLHRFQNKSTILWKQNFKYIYACFFPFNQDIDQVHFFTQEEDITM